MGHSVCPTRTLHPLSWREDSPPGRGSTQKTCIEGDAAVRHSAAGPKTVKLVDGQAPTSVLKLVGPATFCPDQLVL